MRSGLPISPPRRVCSPAVDSLRLRAEVTVAAIVQHEQRFLIVEERIRGALLLNQPAGHVELGETLIDAVIREAREESAWDFRPVALVGTYLWRHPDNGRSTLRFAFCGSVANHDPTARLDRGVVRALWLTQRELNASAARMRSPLVLRSVEDFMAGHRYALDSVASVDAENARRRHAVAL